MSKSFIVLFLYLLIPISASAGLAIGGSRVIYSSDKSDVQLQVTNPDNLIYLVQSWLEYPDNSSKKLPFVITPPLFRLDEKKSSYIRIIRNELSLPDDRESLFWLNIKAIPATPRTDKNNLRFSLRTRIKLFYRPETMKINEGSEPFKKLNYKFVNGNIYIRNPTPFYININKIFADGIEIPESDMIDPFDMISFKLPSSASELKKLTLSVINDYGGVTDTAEIVRTD